MTGTRTIWAVTLLIAVSSIACSGAGSAPPTGSNRPAGPDQTAVGGPPASPAQGSPTALCGLFTPAELAPLLGGQPAPGTVGGPLETACLWDAGEADLMIQKVPVEYLEDYRAAPGYRALDGIGDYAYVAAHAFGRITAARTADASYVVIASAGTDEAAQIELLQRFIERSPDAPVVEVPQVPAGSGLPAASEPGSAVDCPVTTDDVIQATGIPMVQDDGCLWTAADSATLYEVLVSAIPTSHFEYLQAEEPVPGLGDEAYTDQTGALYVRVGARALSLHLITLTLDESKTREVALAIARRAVEGMR